MCGIAGFVGLADKILIKRMSDAIRHRGPDSGGYFIDKNVCLGSRRLAIIDLKSGKQPIHNEDESIWIVFNGEIYNFKQLREKYLKTHKFYTNTDTEVIVHLYEEFGENCVSYLRGMFAFAIWDSAKERLFIARDRLGVKPLYYAYIDNKFFFASELKALLESAYFKREVDISAMMAYIRYRYIPSPLTIFKGIKKLFPGHYLTYSNGNLNLKQYWDVDFTTQSNRGEQYFIDRLEDLLNTSVKLRLISDVPLGAFLSGGLDSSSVVYFMSKHADQPVKTFSIGFREEGYNELKYARAVADYLKTDHHEFVVEPDFIKDLPQMLKQLDEPLADLSFIPTYYVSKLARKYVTVALSGDGGDEVFGGYSWYLKKPTDRLAALIKPMPTVIKKLASSTGNVLASDGKVALLKNGIKIALLSPEERIESRMGVFKDERLYSDEFNAIYKLESQADIFNYYFSNAKAKDLQNKTYYVGFKTFLSEDILVKTDRMSMLNSLELREPLLDHELVEFSASMPSFYKLKGKCTKYIFKKLMVKYLPKNIVYREKMGFNMPFPELLNKDLKSFAENTLLSQEALKRRFLNPQYIQSIISSSRFHKRYSSLLARLIFLELWFRIYIDNQKINNLIG